MVEREKLPQEVRAARARRISTEDPGRGPVDEQVVVVREVPLTIDVENFGSYTLLCTPGEERALAFGFLLSEGVIEGPDQVAEVKPCADDPHTLRVKLTGKSPAVDDENRHLLITSSCGACGSESLDARLEALPVAGETLSVDGSLLRSVSDALREHQKLFRVCGGTHAAGIFDAAGKILAAAEDAGRHNALDKAIGKCLLAGIPTTGHGAALSGRVSMEMVGKCARAGIELITAISAPTTLALDIAERCRITLCAFVREDRATVFTHPSRVTAAKT
jgi:FdhD protein